MIKLPGLSACCTRSVTSSPGTNDGRLSCPPAREADGETAGTACTPMSIEASLVSPFDIGRASCRLDKHRGVFCSAFQSAKGLENHDLWRPSRHRGLKPYYLNH